MVAGGVPQRTLDHARNSLEFAIDVLEHLDRFNKETGNNLQLRIGINTGPVVAGVIGTKKMAFDLWGDAVNVASRMESTGLPGKIQVSSATFEALKDEYAFEERGRIQGTFLR
jgi:class 3 adenylate cyclase